jgi:hypothetical protein
MKSKYLFISVVVLILILVGGYTFRKVTSTEVISTKSVVPEQPSVEKNLFNYKCEVGKSAFDVLNQKAKVEFSESSFGKLVTSIDGKSQGGGKYWLYSVDEKEATVGATAYICTGKEEIKWELR